MSETNEEEPMIAHLRALFAWVDCYPYEGHEAPERVAEFDRWLAEFRHPVSSSVGEDEKGEDAETRRDIAVHTINWLLSEMVVNNAYEYDGKPIYDGLTRQHIDYVVEVMSESAAPVVPEGTKQKDAEQ